MIRIRFFQHFGSAPSFNMAFDEWMLHRAAEAGDILCRLYSWQPGAITIGRHQRAERAVNFEQLNGTEVIRRVTGGRAIYHDPSELTYAVAFPLDGGSGPALTGSVSQTSHKLARMMTSFVTSLGLKARVASRSSAAFRHRDRFHTAPCFESIARHEIMSDGRKLVASAQYRNDRALLQHGSVKAVGVVDHPALQAVSLNVRPGVTEPAFTEAADLFLNAVGKLFGRNAERSDLSTSEHSDLDRFVDEVGCRPLAIRNSIKHIDESVSLLHDRP